MTTNIEGIKKNLMDEADAIFRKGVNAGHEQGFKDGYEEGKENRDYQKGLDDAWEIARKIIEYNESECKQVFGTVLWSHIICGLSASEAKAKIEAWEQKQKEADEIKVGDEVVWDDAKYIVTAVLEAYGEVSLVNSSGESVYALTEQCNKTGRHFNGIAEVLKQMQE